MTRIGATITVCVFISLVANCLKAYEPPGESDALREQVFAELRRQQQHIKSARMQLSGQIDVRSRSSRLALALNTRGRQGGAVEAQPDSAGVKGEFDASIVFMGEEDAVRIETTQPVISQTEATEPLKLIAGSSIDTFDGVDHARSLRVGFRSAAPVGSIYPAEMQNRQVKSLCYKPIFFACRPFSASFIGRSVSGYVVDERNNPQSADIGEHEICLVAANSELWVSLAEGGGVKVHRYIVGDGPGALRCKVVVTKWSVRDGTCLPKAWTCTNYGLEGNIESEIDLHVDRLDMNPPLARDDLLLPFPLGTVVTEYDDEKGDKRWYVDGDGNWIPVSRSEAAQIHRTGQLLD